MKFETPLNNSKAEVFEVRGKKYLCLDSPLIKSVISKDYNTTFRKTDGYFLRWGRTKEEDPPFSPIGPEILDIEITTKCGGGCSYCYKSNTAEGQNMSLETFEKVLDKVNCCNQLGQLAFGLSDDGESNPYLWKMCDYARSKGIVPNGTIANINVATARKIAKYFGACAVSLHQNKNVCYNSIKYLIDAGLKQVNIHFVLYKENLGRLLMLFQDYIHDPRLKGLNAIVLLALKKKGRAVNGSYKNVNQKEFNGIIDLAFKNNIPLGFDSCSAAMFEKYVEQSNLPPKKRDQLRMVSERCESFGLFSSYVDINANFNFCSFCENMIPELPSGLNVLRCKDFLQDVWYHPVVEKYRQKSLEAKRECLVYPELVLK